MLSLLFTPLGVDVYGPEHPLATGSVRRSGRQVNPYTQESLRSFERSRRWGSGPGYKHLTPNRGETCTPRSASLMQLRTPRILRRLVRLGRNAGDVGFELIGLKAMSKRFDAVDTQDWNLKLITRK